MRGFKDQTLTGDSGGYWRNQLRWRRAVEWAPLRPWLQEYGVAFAYDVGVIRHDRYNDGASGRMSGNAIELDARAAISPPASASPARWSGPAPSSGASTRSISGSTRSSETRRPPERFRKAPTCIEALSLENLA
ncbi:ShlB/FhaC/HecB family hemolysin secretion/activation protein [Pseudomonas aeruginosa]|uniref:ShlB/FhaC/HecB family hemolysin secretion/activation protein n=1 Tax=Pseudomonas aeruginosa TaxID=287 RepID=UPI0038620B80|nr:ShlB/FhaC/HecB family hemolysin secretion/activation protein [Pseudomonas aeruginosa]